jgi:ubiquitin carboxyl-terminal hydrolase 36/42
MSCALRAVMEEAHGRRKHAFTPHQVASRLQGGLVFSLLGLELISPTPAIASHMRRGRQEDSHEFLRYAIDALQKSCLAGHTSLV